MSIISDGGAEVRAALARGSAIADAVSWARDLINEPAQAKPPAEVAVGSAEPPPWSRCHRAGARRGAAAPAEARRRVGCGPGVHADTAVPEAHVQAGGCPRQAARVRRQGSGLRLRWALAQDERGHGDHEERHVGGRRGDRRDVGAARARREDARHRLHPAGREHAERHRDPTGRRAPDPQRQDRRSAEHRRRRAPDPRRRALARVRGQARGRDRPGHAHRRLCRRARREDRRPDGQRRRVERAGPGRGRPRRRAGVAAPAAHRLPPRDRLVGRRHQERRTP